MAKTSTKLTRRNKIIDAALKTFAEKGFQDATISEISKAAGVSDATVYEYFNSKEELLFAIPENITKEPLEQMERMLPFLRGADNKVRAIVLGYMILYESNPLYSALVMLQLKSNRNFLRTDAYQQIRRISQILLTCIQEGIDEGIFRRDADPYLIRAMILGTIEHECIRWHLLGKPESLIALVDPLVDMVFDGIRVRKDQVPFAIHVHLADTGGGNPEVLNPGE